MPRAESGWYLVVSLLIAGSGLGLLVSQLNNYTLAPISEERISEAAGVNSAAGSFGLSFGLAIAGGIMLATLSLTFTEMAEASTVLPPSDKQLVAEALEDDAQLMSNTQLDELLSSQPEDIQDEIIRINTEARPIALQIALLVPILAGLIGLINSFRMMRLPEPTPTAELDGVAGASASRPGPTRCRPVRTDLALNTSARLKRWPRDRLAERLSAASYGTILVLAALALIDADDVSSGLGWELVTGVGAADVDCPPLCRTRRRSATARLSTRSNRNREGRS